MKLSLRNYIESDFEALHALVSDYDVVKMTASWPYPADRAFTRKRFDSPSIASGRVSAIEVDGAFAGALGSLRERSAISSPKASGAGV